MKSLEESIVWQTIPHWYRAGLVGFAGVRGLIRVRLNGETMFLGHGEIAGRISAYRSPKGTGKNHYAGQMIRKHKTQIEMQFAAFDETPSQIRNRFDAMLREANPPWNVPDGHRPRG